MDESYYEEEFNYPSRPDWSAMDYVSEETLLEECRQRAELFSLTNQTTTDGLPAKPDIHLLLYVIIGLQMFMLIALASLTCNKKPKQQKEDDFKFPPPPAEI